MGIAGWSYRQIGQMSGCPPMKVWRRHRKNPQKVLEETMKNLGVGDGKGEKSGPKKRAEVSKDLRAYQGIFDTRRDMRNEKEQRLVKEWVELVTREVERGVQKTDIARESGMSRDQFNYRMKNEV